MNHLYYGDNLLVLRDSIASESVDLIYLRGGGGDKGGLRAGGPLLELHRVLKPTGSLYLHWV